MPEKERFRSRGQVRVRRQVRGEPLDSRMVEDDRRRYRTTRDRFDPITQFHNHGRREPEVEQTGRWAEALRG